MEKRAPQIVLAGIDNVRPLICPHVVRHRRRPSGLADVIELYPRARRGRRTRAVVLPILGMLALITLGTALIIDLLKGVDFTTVVPYWPLW